MTETENNNRIDAKQAAANAISYYEYITQDNRSEALIEEIELNDDDQWMITLSHRDPNQNSMIYGAQGLNRKYKTFLIDAYTGEVESMKIKKI